MKNTQNWTTPASFQSFEDKILSFIMGNARFSISDIQFHIHKIDSSTAAHTHNNYQIIYYSKGNGTQHIGNKKYKVNPNSVFFVPPEKTHKFIPDKGSVAQAFTLIFEIDFDSSEKPENADADFNKLLRLLYERKLEFFNLEATESKRAQNLINRLQKELTSQEFGFIMEVNGILLLLLRIFLKAGIRKEIDATPLVRKQLVYLKASDYIRRNIHTTVTLNQIAKSCHVSGSYIQKVFKEYAGKSVTSVIHESKIDYAAHLLKTTDMPIKQISFECGISDRNYFTRTFKKVIGVSPRQYRNT
ncbi:MAG: helix-turn-helix domain-containing protein [Planctomycetota bacterium]|jgi:AraC-like DNA-binding protein/quercetin dioxygenase-like cupin family protein